ncbi:DUF1329 domain-containing protein [Zavarzinia compransoris]|uniref:DUF1329 domain-containing protein n=2 Tax=Zavarzinia compransoris TaxID=1264899 RepID=A0A317E5N8_9PROT|nr:DUF1329 domain-containing protein [Zavarzinia compransoris]
MTEGEAARLGADLTPTGAERAGNAAGTIPAWDGGLAVPLPGIVPGTSRPDPYPDDKPLFRITAANLDQYRGQLSDGQAAMLKRYAGTYYMNVYPTRRSAALPPAIYAAIKAQASRTELADGGNGINNLGQSTVPFPQPKTGQEAIWNHLVRYRGEAIDRRVLQAVVQGNGSYAPVIIRDMISFRPSFAGRPDLDNTLFMDVQRVLAPQRLAGTALLAIDAVNQVLEARQAWVYNAGMRRVLRAPEVAYDNPGTAADGARTTDNYDMYNGAIDRYDWKLIGKRETYVPYNANRIDARALKYDDIIRPGHLNPEHLRYELHRVWTVEATLKEGQRHIYAKRVFYLDEDTWSALAIDHYDGRGQLWRVAEGHLLQYTEATVPLYAVEVLYDLNDDRYLAFGMNNEEPYELNFDWRAEDGFYTPSNLRRFSN